MQSDRYRLLQLWQRVGPQWLKDPNCKAFQSWLQFAKQSQQRFQQRAASIPSLEYDEELPITEHRQELIQLLQTRQTIVICGETGSGKSTQLPKICLEAGLGRSGMIGHTQPRRLAARAVASRLASELGSNVGGLVGFKIRFADATNANTLVKLMTDGVLLAETQSDRFLDQYDAIIIDEAHERSLNIDFLLGYLRRIQVKRPDLKLIITSATIDPESFANHFADQDGPAPIVEVSGRTYPVELRYRPPAELAGDEDVDEAIYHRAIANAADELLLEGQGDILVFLPTERDIRSNSKYLRGHFAASHRDGQIEILPLYARLSQDEQNKIFAEHKKRRIILATNVAESSLTVPGIHFVIDTGLVRLSRYATRSKVQRLPIEPISQASANQRSGRCGRLGPGVCIRLYEESDFSSRPRFTTPEIRRSDLANVMLQSYMLRLGPLEQFPLIESPTPEAIRDGLRTLRELSVIDDKHHLTELGKQLGKLPCDVRVGRMLLEAHQRGCLAEVILIAAGLESQDVRQRPAGMRPQADAAHERFKDPHSDFLSYIRLWDFYEKLSSDLGRSRLQKALNQNFLSFHGFREWGDIVRQLRELLTSAGLKPGPRKITLPELAKGNADEPSQQPSGKAASNPPSNEKAPERPQGYAPIHQSLLAGLLSGIAERNDRFQYKAAGGVDVKLWPGSGLFRRSPKWIVAAEVVETSGRFARTIAELDVEWIEAAAKDLLKHSYSQPHWSEKSGSAMVYRKSTLFGLTIVVGRRVPLAPIDMASARSLLIEHGLVAGQWRCDLDFYRHNVELIADIEELLKRTRERKYIVDRFHLTNFYDSRLPEDVHDLNTLRSWTGRHRGQAVERGLWMTPEDFLDPQANHGDVANDFPNTLKVGSAEFPLTYHFEPGSPRDGVTITIPQVALRQVSQQALAWLVPGLLEDKIAAIIKSLPKSLRTSFVPAPDVARQLAQQLRGVDRSIPFSSVLAEKMTAYAGQSIGVSDIDLSKLPEHLNFLVQVVDAQGVTLDQGRDVDQLIAEHGLSGKDSSQAISEEAQHWKDVEIRSPQDLDGLPKQILLHRGGVKVVAFPALVDTGKGVLAKLVDTPAEAERLSRGGVTRLFALKNDKLLRGHVKHLPRWNEAALALGKILPAASLQSGIQDLMVRMALIEGQPAIAGSLEFDARQARASAQLAVAAQEIAVWLPQLASSFQELRLRLEKAPAMWQEVVEAIRGQLSELAGPAFLADTPWQWLKEYPRYFQAAKLRMEKLSQGGVAKDRKLFEPIATARQAFRQLQQSPRCGDPQYFASLNELRWMIEELQVSIFAQQLGTKITVSPKRVQELIGKLS